MGTSSKLMNEFMISVVGALTIVASLFFPWFGHMSVAKGPNGMIIMTIITLAFLIGGLVLIAYAKYKSKIIIKKAEAREEAKEKKK